jgi:hypothetical protein
MITASSSEMQAAVEPPSQLAGRAHGSAIPRAQANKSLHHSHSTIGLTKAGDAGRALDHDADREPA